ncbi:hypothetical protein [Falsiroseomonas selenitidurans]|uniref:Translation initiation factor IF-2 n=1 Tax=Falsiroseomonas selenitidurans TaxID=2716335 RepID=A0ABX1E719_9PROT|nr:hypothetical protein [Falsiroseomonas selenitidurans]NKC31327.1 hypothetical protein [Falsiroseomonas selenitidurans]
MTLTLLLPLGMAKPAAAQNLLQGGPAANAVPPATEMPRSPPPAQANPPPGPADGVGAPRNLAPRTAPPPDHQTMPAPPVPGARQPRRSDGWSDFGDSPIPPRPGAGRAPDNPRAPGMEPRP